FELQGVIQGRFTTIQKTQKQSDVAVLQCAHVGTSGYPRPARACGVALSRFTRRADPRWQGIDTSAGFRSLSDTAPRFDHYLHCLDGSIATSAPLASLARMPSSA